MRPSTLLIAGFGALVALHGAMVVHAQVQAAAAVRARSARAEVVRRLRVTDLCLFTEARYTRHPAMADRHAPFQDHPMALDHFPSGSVLAPPPFPSPHAAVPPAPPQRP